MIRILNAEPEGYSDEAARILASFAEVEARPLDRAGLLEELPGYDALIVRLRFAVDAELLAAGPQLRAVVTATTGLDHIDMASASAGVEVISLRGEREFLDGIHATAEHTWALLLALLRRLPWAAASVVAGHWERERFRGHELFGKRLGIVGLGRVGLQVAQFGRAFGMYVTAFDAADAVQSDGIQSTVTLRALLESSDVVSLHAPLDGSTVGMIGREEFASMQSGSVLVNTARGELVDEPALLDVLDRGGIAGAAIDVLIDERSPRRGADLVAFASAHENLLITPHIAGATYESMEKCEVFTAARLAEFFGADA